MLTVLLAWAHAKRNNKEFNPDLMYFGTFILDYMIISAIVGALL